MVRVPERRAHYAICDVSPCYTTRLSPLDLEKSSPSNNVLLHRRDRDISFEQHREKFRICTDQRLFNVKETHCVTVRREGRRIGTRILEGRGYREQLDGSTDVNGEGERERERYNGETRPLHSSSLSYLLPEPVRSSLVGNGRGVHGGPRRRRVKSTRCQPREPGERAPLGEKGPAIVLCLPSRATRFRLHISSSLETHHHHLHTLESWRLHAQIILPDI